MLQVRESKTLNCLPSVFDRYDSFLFLSLSESDCKPEERTLSRRFIRSNQICEPCEMAKPVSNKPRILATQPSSAEGKARGSTGSKLNDQPMGKPRFVICCSC